MDDIPVDRPMCRAAYCVLVDQHDGAHSPLHYSLLDDAGQPNPKHATCLCHERCPCCGAKVTGEPYDIGSGPERSCPHCEWCWGVNGQPLQPLDAEAILRSGGLSW